MSILDLVTFLADPALYTMPMFFVLVAVGAMIGRTTRRAVRALREENARQAARERRF